MTSPVYQYFHEDGDLIGCERCNSEYAATIRFKTSDVRDGILVDVDERLCPYCYETTATGILKTRSEDLPSFYHRREIEAMAQCFNLLEKRIMERLNTGIAPQVVDVITKEDA